MSRRILFVDDEPNVLMGLQRTLRPMQTEWVMEFVSSGDEALKALSLGSFDAVVTDMRMPGMTGAQLLDQVKNLYPHTARFVLSGQSDQESIVRSFTTAHQFLSKPCEAEQLRSLLDSSIAVTDLLANVSIKNFISRLKCIPSLPLLYRQVALELRSPNPSAARLGEIIEQDIAMTAKLLQMVNSAAYGVRGQIAKPSEAVLLLGLDTIQTMVLSLSIFSVLDPQVLSEPQAKDLWEHSVAVSRLSTYIAKAEGVAARSLDPYQSGGLLHDIGKLVIASADARQYRMIENLTSTTGRDQCAVETEILGCNHAEIGAYLLRLWGLPTSIVEAVAWHHHPSGSPLSKFCPLAAVHVANSFHAQLHPAFKQRDTSLDDVFLQRLGLTGRLEGWMAQCSEQCAEA